MDYLKEFFEGTPEEFAERLKDALPAIFNAPGADAGAMGTEAEKKAARHSVNLLNAVRRAQANLMQTKAREFLNIWPALETIRRRPEFVQIDMFKRRPDLETAAEHRKKDVFATRPPNADFELLAASMEANTTRDLFSESERIYSGILSRALYIIGHAQDMVDTEAPGIPKSDRQRRAQTTARRISDPYLHDLFDGQLFPFLNRYLTSAAALLQLAFGKINFAIKSAESAGLKGQIKPLAPYTGAFETGGGARIGGQDENGRGLNLNAGPGRLYGLLCENAETFLREQGEIYAITALESGAAVKGSHDPARDFKRFLTDLDVKGMDRTHRGAALVELPKVLGKTDIAAVVSHPELTAMIRTPRGALRAVSVGKPLKAGSITGDFAGVILTELLRAYKSRENVTIKQWPEIPQTNGHRTKSQIIRAAVSYVFCEARGGQMWEAEEIILEPGTRGRSNAATREPILRVQGIKKMEFGAQPSRYEFERLTDGASNPNNAPAIWRLCDSERQSGKATL